MFFFRGGIYVYMATYGSFAQHHNISQRETRDLYGPDRDLFMKQYILWSLHQSLVWRKPVIFRLFLAQSHSFLRRVTAEQQTGKNRNTQRRDTKKGPLLLPGLFLSKIRYRWSPNMHKK